MRSIPVRGVIGNGLRERGRCKKFVSEETGSSHPRIRLAAIHAVRLMRDFTRCDGGHMHALALKVNEQDAKICAFSQLFIVLCFSSLLTEPRKHF